MTPVVPVSAKLAIARGPVLPVSLIVAGVIAGLAVIDVSLERTEQSELAALALQADRNGQQLLAKGEAAGAVDAFRKAHALERENSKYTLDLIQALMAANKLDEAQPLMNGILEEDSNDSEANLVAARLAAKNGDISSADAYYHRAIYGEWPSDLSKHQIAVRLELIEYLNAHGKQSETLAELLPLEEQAAKDLNLQPKLAQLFMVAGSPSRAADIYRHLIKLDPKNPANWEGLGDAELELGDFREAHAAFWNTVTRDGNNTQWRERLDLASTLSNLDPTLRRLSTQDKYSRAIKILQLATTGLQQCVTNHPELATDDATQLVTTAQKQLASPASKQVSNEMAEDALSLAERIWHTRTSLCGQGTAPDEEPLRLIMEKLAK